MLRLRILAGLLVVVLTAGCKAQNAPPAGPDAALNRRIETVVRSQYDLPQDLTVTIGARKASQFSGYESLSVTLSHGTKTQALSFLISSDNKTLVKFDSFDLSRDPADAVNITGRPIRGNPLAKVTVVNFDDLECPFCARMHQELFPGAMEHYKDQVRYIYKDDPLVEIHPWALRAAVDANCLAQRNLDKSKAALDRIARQEATVGKLDEVQLNACLAKQDETQVRASNKEAEALGLDGTPELYVNGERVNGAVPQDQLWAAIDRALRAAGEQPPPPLPPPAPVPAKPAPAAPVVAPPAPTTSK